MNIEPQKARTLLSPRICALISTMNEDDSVNASPYSWVFPFSFSPPMAMIGIGGRGVKRTQKNAEREKEFVINFISKNFGQKAIKLEAIHGANQLEEVGLNSIDSKEVKTKGIAESKIRIECKLVKTLDVPESDHVFIIGEIVSAFAEKMDGNFPDLDAMEILQYVGGKEFRTSGEKVILERNK